MSACREAEQERNFCGLLDRAEHIAGVAADPSSRQRDDR
jgi:hypothetical protein